MSTFSVEAKYTLKDEVLSRLELLEKKFAHFDSTLAKTDNLIKKVGTKTSLANIIPSGGKLEKGINMLNDIPNLNMGIASSAGVLANPYVAAGAAVAAFGVVAADGTRMAMDWNKGMAAANVTMQLSKAELNGVSDQLKGMDRYGANLEAIPASFEKIVSGVGDTKKAIDIMTVALKSARANFADLDVTGDALVNVMGSAGNQFKNAEQISDLLTKTKILGKAEFNDMATYLPRIIPYANQLGFQVKEVAGAMALLTAKGQTTEQTTMLLQNAFVAMADGKKRGNIEKFVKLFDKGKIRPFADIMVDIKKKMDGLNGEGKLKFLNALDLDAQAGSAFQQLIQNTDILKSNVKELGDSAGATNKALSDSANGQDAIDKLKAKWDGLKMKLGEKIEPYFSKVVDWMMRGVEWMERLEQRTGFFSQAWKVLTNVLKIAWSPWIRLYNIGVQVHDWATRFGNYLHDRFPKAFSAVSFVVQVLTGYVKDLWFVLTETFDVLTKLVTFDWKAIGDNVTNFKSRDWAINGQKETPSITGADKAEVAQILKDKRKEDMLDHISKILPSKKGTASLLLPDVPTEKKTKEEKARDAREARGINEISGGGTQIRNVQVVIQKQIEKVEVITTNMQDASVGKIKKILEELLVTSVRDAELALGH